MTFQHPDDLASPPTAAPPRGLYVFVDGPSIDGTLGRVIGQPPGPDTRPDWRRLESFIKQKCGPAPYSATFVFWSPGQQGFMHFLSSSGFMIALGDRHVPGQSCVDLIRQRITQLNQAALPDQRWQVIVGTHNEDLINALPLLADQAERISVFGFSEFLPEEGSEIESQIDIYDIEDDAHLFRSPLPRIEVEVEADYPFAQQPAATAHQDLTSRQLVFEAAPAPPEFTRLEAADTRDFFLIVDGRSIEKELGEILGEKPNPETRPDWGTVLEFARSRSQSADGAVKALFAHIAPGHTGFRRALKDIGYTSSAVKLDDAQPARPVVEEFVCGLLAARAFRGDDGVAPDIMVLGHGQAIFDALSEIPDTGQRLGALGFPERMPPTEFYPRIEQFDLERDARAFAAELPREFGIDVDNFDPDEELSRLF